MPALVDCVALLLLVVLCLSCLSGRSTAEPLAMTVPTRCPPAVSRRVTHLYSCYLRSGSAYRDRIHEQERVFEPALYADLLAAFRLEHWIMAFLILIPSMGSDWLFRLWVGALSFCR